MAPKKGTARVVKPKDKPRKAASANVAAAAREAAKADNDLHLMWLCLKNNGGSQIDYQAVADALGISKNAAKQRFYKIKNHCEGQLAAAQTTEDEELKTDDQPDEDQEELRDYKSEGNGDEQEEKQEQPEDENQEA